MQRLGVGFNGMAWFRGTAVNAEKNYSASILDEDWCANRFLGGKVDDATILHLTYPGQGEG